MIRIIMYNFKMNYNNENKYFKYISDEIFYQGVLKLVKNYSEKKNKIKIVDLFKNKLDPFHISIESTMSNITALNFLNNIEKGRQLGKSLSNWIGKFHEEMMKNLEGFEKATNSNVEKSGTTQADIINKKLKMVVEVKNKWNTMKGSDYKSVFDSLELYINNNYEIAYLLIINAKKSVEDVWSFKHKEIEYKNDRIHTISIDRFLHKVTGDSQAFNSYINAFLRALKDVHINLSFRTIDDDLLEELRENVFDENYKDYK